MQRDINIQSMFKSDGTLNCPIEYIKKCRNFFFKVFNHNVEIKVKQLYPCIDILAIGI